LRSGPVA